MKRIEIVKVDLSDNRGSKWIVKVDGKPVRNFWTQRGAERFAASL